MQYIEKQKLISGSNRDWAALILSGRRVTRPTTNEFQKIKGMGKEASMKWLFTMCLALHHNLI